MANHVLLDNINHKDLKIMTKRSASLGDNIPSLVTFPFEYRDIQTNFPICFCKDSETGKFYTAALFGFEENENLFLDGDNWDAAYTPLMLERQPFFIGNQQKQNGEEERLIYIDMDSPRVGSTDGEALFLEQGGVTNYLQRMSAILEAIHQGQQQAKEFVELMLKHNLKVELNDGTNNQLQGFYTINEDALDALSSEAVSELWASGYMQAAYMVIASMSNFRSLIERKNKRL
ncbi:MAG: SapC family protein [Porticoccaceae bacterium]|nr:SapC family protein [Porticoccaceae bacterium]